MSEEEEEGKGRREGEVEVEGETEGGREAGGRRKTLHAIVLSGRCCLIACSGLLFGVCVWVIVLLSVFV